jgi:ubiquinol-cytochrome c reductase cytochrome b subunit
MAADAVDEDKAVDFALAQLKELKDEIGEEELRKQATEAAEEDEFEDFVEENASDELIERLGNERLQELVAMLAAESQREEIPEEVDEEMEFLIEDFGCADCHKFYNVGDLGSAPDLTGYGSRQWLVGIISNPEDERFYPDTNDGMPKYHFFPDEPQKNLLDDEQIRLLTDLLRGKLDSE